MLKPVGKVFSSQCRIPLYLQAVLGKEVWLLRVGVLVVFSSLPGCWMLRTAVRKCALEAKQAPALAPASFSFPDRGGSPRGGPVVREECEAATGASAVERGDKISCVSAEGVPLGLGLEIDSFCERLTLWPRWTPQVGGPAPAPRHCVLRVYFRSIGPGSLLQMGSWGFCFVLVCVFLVSVSLPSQSISDSKPDLPPGR